MGKTEAGGLTRSRTMLFMGAVLEIGKRIGLGKQMVGLAMRRMQSQTIKKKAFADYRPTKHDVFVTTFAKSGTNWMMQIAQQISHRGEAEFPHIHAVAPWPDAPGPGPIPLEDCGPRDASPTNLRIIKTHLESGFVPYNEASTYLTVLRDPKEVLVSSYYFLGGVLGVLSHVTIEDWYEITMAPGGLMESWATHTASFWAWRDRPNVLVMTFPEIKRAPRESIERVAATMGVDLTEAQLLKVIERSTVDYMKEHEAQFAPPQAPFGDKANPTLMIRRGATGKSEELLSEAQQARIDHLCLGELRKIQSDFPYAREFEVVEST